MRQRLSTTRLVGKGVRAWLQKNRFDAGAVDLQAFLLQWELRGESDEFKLSPPGRLRFTRHLLQYPRHYGLRMTWRHKLVSYLNALGALLTGYRYYDLLDEFRVRIKGALFGRRSFANSDKAAPEQAPTSIRQETPR